MNIVGHSISKKSVPSGCPGSRHVEVAIEPDCHPNRVGLCIRDMIGDDLSPGEIDGACIINAVSSRVGYRVIISVLKHLLVYDASLNAYATDQGIEAENGVGII